MPVPTAVMVGLVGLILVVIGAMAWNGRLEPNMFVGIRVPSLLASREAWKAGHRAAAPILIAVGALTIGYALALVVLGSRLVASPVAATRVLEWGWVLVLLGSAGASTALAVRAARRATPS